MYKQINVLLDQTISKGVCVYPELCVYVCVCLHSHMCVCVCDPDHPVCLNDKWADQDCQS